MTTEHNFKPAWWLPNSHLQTLWPFLCRRDTNNIKLVRERFELADGDFIDIDWVGENHKPIVLILHGFEGSIKSHYAKGILQTITRHGWRGAFMHFRGCSGEHNRLPTSYHSGETKDVNYIVHILREREPNVPIAAIGFSLGGNVLLKWLGEANQNNPLTAAVAISVPFELEKAVNKVQYGFSRTYQWYLLKCACTRLANKFKKNTSPIDTNVFSNIKSFREFDNKVTAPLHGFLNADDYYAKASCRQFLRNITVPTLLLHAKDDPFMTEDAIPKMHELSDVVTLEASENGGHVGFVGGKFPWSAEYWLEKRIPLFLKDYLIR